MLTEEFIWGTGKQHGFLKVRTLYDENDKPLLSREFHYDSQGNVIKETLYGRFTENSRELHIDKEGYPSHSSCDKVSTNRTFSYDGYNLKLSEEDPLGNFTYYEYYPRSNLLKAKFTCDKQEIKKRRSSQAAML